MSDFMPLTLKFIGDSFSLAAENAFKCVFNMQETDRASKGGRSDRLVLSVCVYSYLSDLIIDYAGFTCVCKLISFKAIYIDFEGKLSLFAVDVGPKNCQSLNKQ